MEKMHEFIGFIFHDVWCKAPGNEYGIHLFEACEPLHQIMDELYRQDLADVLKDGAGKRFYQSVNEIYNEFKKLNEDDIVQYRSHFLVNNSIEELCSSIAEHSPARYCDLNPTLKTLNDRLEEFFKSLYASGFFSLKPVKNAIGSDLNTYYADFVRENSSGCCPFCGLQPIDNEFDPTREAFDHYLPKSKYPFNTVNLKNLVPSCHKCNSGNKGNKDPIHDENNNRRKSFYPFTQMAPDIQLSVVIQDRNWSPLTPEKLSISFYSVLHQEEINTWNDLFRIESRYLAKCCDSGGGQYWLNRIFSERHNYKLSVQDMLDAEMQNASNEPWVDSNFLKKIFLEGCQQAGLFDVIARNGVVS
jgi:hypothetical protein